MFRMKEVNLFGKLLGVMVSAYVSVIAIKRDSSCMWDSEIPKFQNGRH